MMKIKLDEAARERYGCAEWLDWDASRLSVAEAEEVQERCGVNPNDWNAYLNDGGARAIHAVVWIALNRAGHQIGWDDVDFDVLALDIQGDKPRRGKGSRSTPPPPSEPDAKP